MKFKFGDKVIRTLWGKQRKYIFLHYAEKHRTGTDCYIIRNERVKTATYPDGTIWRYGYITHSIERVNSDELKKAKVE